MAKAYTCTFQLWDITEGEETGDLLRERKDVSVVPLNTIQSHFWTFLKSVRKFAPLREDLTPKQEEALIVRIDSLRVSMSRNAGTGIYRARIDLGDKVLRFDSVVTKQEDYPLLQTLYATFNSAYARPRVELEYSVDDKVYWVTVAYTADMEPPKTVRGYHPLTGVLCSATLQDTDTSERMSRVLYLID